MANSRTAAAWRETWRQTSPLSVARNYQRAQIFIASRLARGGYCRTMRPHWRAVYQYFKIWKQDGTWLKIHDYLHEQLREKMPREKQPSAAIVDSQSVKTTEKGGRKEVTMEARK